MAEQPLFTAASRAVALRFGPNWMGGGGTDLQRQVNAAAITTARSLEAAGPVLGSAQGLDVSSCRSDAGLFGSDLLDSTNPGLADRRDLDRLAKAVVRGGAGGVWRQGALGLGSLSDTNRFFGRPRGGGPGTPSAAARR